MYFYICFEKVCQPFFVLKMVNDVVRKYHFGKTIEMGKNLHLYKFLQLRTLFVIIVAKKIKTMLHESIQSIKRN